MLRTETFPGSVPGSAYRPGLELWGGAECTVNRTENGFFDQSRATGHDERDDDIDRLASLRLAALRFPLLWERVAPDDPEQRDWRWSDARLAALSRHGIRPIAGLVHHGSGPRYTSLLDPGFAPGLAAHAAAAARRYPWISEWTPVNEPLTTARFSALYGLWYPHARDERLFWTALVNQIEGVQLAMAEIRKVIPRARLVQTEDLGRTWATARMAQQAAFDNTRRWMTWDLLCGRVVPGHALWERLSGFGLGEHLRRLADAPCPPDIIGVNHYLTSDRFLDHRTAAYPAEVVGGNGREAYADVAAVRALDPAPRGLEMALRDAWERYRLPLAVTEVHNGCTREEQLRWTAQAWTTCQSLRGQGIDVRAMTAWALFGNRGWNTLLTEEGLYEPGAWDVRPEPPRETSLGGLLRRLGSAQPDTDASSLPEAVTGAGWWERPLRLHHDPAPRAAPLRDHRRAPERPRTAAPIVILGATGTLGRAFARACHLRNLPCRLISRRELDLARPDLMIEALRALGPWAVINAAGWVRVDEAEGDPQGCMAANAAGAIALAQACDDLALPCISFSSDLVFGADAAEWFVEGDRPAPINVYGRSKSAMEAGVLDLGGRHMVVRTAAFFSPDDVHNFAVHALSRLRGGQPFQAAGCVVSPTYVPDLCHSVLDLLIDGESGLWHLSNGGAVSWAEFAQRIAFACDLDASLVEQVSGADLGWTAPRPDRCALASERGSPMPSLDAAIESFARAMA